MGNSWGHTLRPLTAEECTDLAGHWGEFCTAARCSEKSTHLSTYSYVTGRAGRVSYANRRLCTTHAGRFAAKHGLAFDGSGP